MANAASRHWLIDFAFCIKKKSGSTTINATSTKCRYYSSSSYLDAAITLSILSSFLNALHFFVVPSTNATRVVRNLFQLELLFEFWVLVVVCSDTVSTWCMDNSHFERRLKLEGPLNISGRVWQRVHGFFFITDGVMTIWARRKKRFCVHVGWGSKIQKLGKVIFFVRSTT